jgi:proline iminopeptidase
MRIKVADDVALFVDVDGAALVPDGQIMRARPTVVLLHGGPGMDHSSFKCELAALTDVAQLVYVDHRGNGRSDTGARSDWTLAQWADDVRVVCDVLGIESPIVLGHSFGGFVAQCYAIRHPRHPGALILSSTAARANVARNLAVFERLGGTEAQETAARFYADPSEESLGEFITRCMPLYNTRAADLEEGMRAVFNPEVTIHFFKHEYAQWNALDALGNIVCPTLILGGEDDPTTPIQDQQDIANRIRGDLVEYHQFADCGHGAFRDQPEQALAVIRDFILRQS